MRSSITLGKWFVIISLVLLAITASACGTSPAPEPTRTIALTPMPTQPPPPTSTRVPTPRPTRTIDEVTKTAPTSQYLDGKHMSKGLQCQACHPTMPPKGLPAMSVCLNCHNGSMTALAEKTNRVEPNPHVSHVEVESCADCHTGHGPFVYGCGKEGCHTEYSNTRFR